MQPRLPSEIVKAVQTAPGAQLPAGRDDGAPEAAVPAGVFVHERGGGQTFRDHADAERMLRITILWKRQAWRWALIAAAVPFILLPAALLLDAHVRVLGIMLLPVSLGGGLLFVYDQLGRLLNRTEVTLESGLLTIRHAPLRWAGNHRVGVESIRTMEVVQDGMVTRVLSDVGPGPESCLLRSTATMGLTSEQAAYVADRVMPFLPRVRAAQLPANPRK